MTERQELYCHGCNQYVQFDLDTELDGQHTITCPSCGHEHYRYIDRGRISDRRWASSGPVLNPNAPTGGSYYVTGATASSASVMSNFATGGTAASYFIAQSWVGTTTSSYNVVVS